MTTELSQRLAQLKLEADAKRQKYAQASQQHKSNSLSVAKLRSDMLASREAWTEAYKAAGLNRQQAWQVSRIAAGLCRNCGKPSDSPNCTACKEKMRKAYAKRGKRKKLVQQ